MKRALILLLVQSLIISTYTRSSTSYNQATPSEPQLEFIKSALGDYLYFLFCRKQHPAVPELDSLIGIRDVPSLRGLIALPEIITSEQIVDYNDVYKIIDRYYGGDTLSTVNLGRRISYNSHIPAAEEIKELVKSGEAAWPEFLKYWEEYLAPLEDQQIAVWSKQLRDNDVMHTYAGLTKIDFKSDRLQVAAMAYHMAGSCNYNPHGVFTSLFKKPNLPWVLGHEATHILLSEFEADWMSDPRVADLKPLIEQTGYQIYDIEEATCIFLQAALARQCATVSADYYMHFRFEDEFISAYIKSLEMNIEEYLMDGNMDIIDYMISTAEKILSKKN